MRTCFGLAEKPENVVNQLAMSDSKQASEESVQERITLSGINDLSLPVRAMGFGALGVLVLIYLPKKTKLEQFLVLVGFRLEAMSRC